uniref:ACB domain-containing protein n=1 Tax=Timema monikensis TaxID=170555 RepID=A0A7R9HTG9_9NEOP|nr:unnamed protein product [Timema monikensis]
MLATLLLVEGSIRHFGYKFDYFCATLGTISQGRCKILFNVESCLQRFTKAAEDVKVLKATPTDDELLEVYALYKQATVGDVNTVVSGISFQCQRSICQAIEKYPCFIFMIDVPSLVVHQQLPKPFRAARPGLFDFKGKSKWDAWEKKKGTSTADAKEAYISKVKQLEEVYSKN